MTESVLAKLMTKMKFVLLMGFLSTAMLDFVVADDRVYCVVAQGANLRTGPGLEFDVSLRVNQYMPLRIQEDKDGWIKVEDMYKKNHWVSKKVVSNSTECVVVQSETAFLRTGPGKEFIKDGDVKVDKFTPLKKLGVERGWVKVETLAGDQFWIYATNLWKP